MLLNFSQPLQGTTRSHLTGKPAGVQGSGGCGHRDNCVDMLAARVTTLFAPYMTDIGDTEFLYLSKRLYNLLCAARRES